MNEVTLQAARPYLVKSAQALRKLSVRNAELEKKAAAHDKLAAANEAIRAMIQHGHLTNPEEVLAKQAELLSQSDDEIAVLTKAAQMGSSMSSELARLSDEPDLDSGGSAEGRFLNFLMN